MIGLELEDVEHLVEHGPVLGRDADTLSNRLARWRAWTTGAILIASGRVPKTLRTRIIARRDRPQLLGHGLHRDETKAPLQHRRKDLPQQPSRTPS